MSNIDDRFPSRKSPRLRGYDYTAANYYFVTICTWEKKCLFGEPNHLNDWGKTAAAGLEKIGEHYAGVCVDKFVVMPNHIHAILVLPGKITGLSEVIGSYKSYVTRRIHTVSPNLRVWQTSFHDHVIRGREDYEKIWEYIHTNPIKWEQDCFYFE